MKFLHILLVILLLVPAGCDTDGAAQTKTGYDEAIRRVQDSESTLPGSTTERALDVVLASLTSEGYEVQPEGWTCTYRDRQYYIWYNLKIDKSPVKFHWVVSGAQSIVPVNELARTITKRCP